MYRERDRDTAPRSLARTHRLRLLHAPGCNLAAPRLARRLKAAKKRGLIAYSAPILLKGSHDKVPITLLVPAEGSEEAAHH